MTASRPRGDLDSILDSVRRIVRVLRLASHASERRVGLSAAQLFVLRKLADRPASSLADVAARTHTDQSSVSVVVQRLVERRLVSRERSVTDARQRTLALTPAGRRLLRGAPDPVQERLVGALAGLPAADRRRLAALLGRVVRDLGATNEPATMFFEEGNDATPAPRRRDKPARNRAARKLTAAVRRSSKDQK
jgi:DNA-binding MarR family transcriptional regulator